MLIVEDDVTIAVGLEYSLQEEGYQTILCQNITDAKKVLAERILDFCIFDLTLPDGNGYELCRLAKEKPNLPVLFLTACDDEVNVVMGLDMGADDYITKPFRIRELMSRMKSILRRYPTEGDDRAIALLGDLTINTLEAKVFKGGEEILLTALEYRLLLTFLNNRRQVLSRSQILESIWDVAGNFVNDNTLTVYIKRLREKLEEDPQNPKLIQTVRGLGYKVDC